MEVLDQIPLWLVLILTIGLSLLCIEGGFRIGVRNAGKEQEAAIGPMVSAMLSLLAFMLAFTYEIAAARFDDRRTLVVEEANAIGTTYLRADFIEEPARTKVKNLLREYVDIRVKDIFQKDALDPVLIKADGLENQLWQQAALVGQKHPDSKTIALFIDSLNQMMDVHGKRTAARLCSRVPEVIWYTLFFVAAISMLKTGYKCGIAGTRSLLTSTMLAITFSAVIALVADLDRPWEGFLQAKQLPMIDLRNKLIQSVP